MDSFSWSDSFRATLGSCLPCLSRGVEPDDELDQQVGRGGARSAREELERLLDEPMTDHEAETMSLHSNVGGARRKKKDKRKTHKSIRILGVDLFGRRSIPAEEDAEDEDGPTRGSRARTSGLISTSTLDSDAAPLADDAISDFATRAQQRWAPDVTDEQLTAEEAAERERLEKEEHRARRRERRELNRLAEMGIFNSQQNLDEFEGFPGSGSGVSRVADDFGPFVGGQAGEPPAQREQEDEGVADFDAVAYTSKRGAGSSSEQNGSSHSRKHSRTSASLSAAEDRNRRPAHTPMSHTNFEGQTTKPAESKRRKSDAPSASSAVKSGSSNRSKSSHGSTPSTSLRSPSIPPSPSVQVKTQPEVEFEGQGCFFRLSPIF